MTYQTLDAINQSEGLQTLFIYANDVTGGALMPLMLFGFFMIVMLGNYFAQKRMVGDGNLPAAFTVAGFVTFGLSIILAIIPELLNPFIPLVCLAVSVIGVLWLVFSGEA